MKPSPFGKTLFLYLFFLSGTSVIIAQQTTDESALKKQEAAVAAAQANVDKYETQLTVADSLISVGNQMITEAKSEMKSAENDRKKIEKDPAKPSLIITIHGVGYKFSTDNTSHQDPVKPPVR